MQRAVKLAWDVAMHYIVWVIPSSICSATEPFRCRLQWSCYSLHSSGVEKVCTEGVFVTLLWLGCVELIAVVCLVRGSFCFASVQQSDVIKLQLAI